MREQSGYNLRRDRKYGHLHGRWREREGSGDSARLHRISVREALNSFPGSAMQVMKKEFRVKTHKTGQLKMRGTLQPRLYLSGVFLW
jgi:hypothetical protein